MRVPRRIYNKLYDKLKNDFNVMTWLNTPHKDLGDYTPENVISFGHSKKVLKLIKNMS